jgi:hypothetical protein
MKYGKEKGEKEEKEAAGLLVGLLEKEPESKKGSGEGDDEDAEAMKAARIEALKAFKGALDAEDFEAADEAWADYKAACDD